MSGAANGSDGPSNTWMTRYSFVSELSEAGRRRLESSCSPLSAPTGTILLDEGQESDPVLFLERGEIRVFKGLGDGDEITLYRVRASEMCVLGVVSALGAVLCPATAAAAEPVEGYAIPASVFREIFSEEPALQRYVIRLVADRLANMIDAVLEVGFERLDQRLARFLMNASGEGPDARLVKMTHEQIARELGTAREVVTRLLDALKAQGILRLGRRRISLSRPDELRDLARGSRK